MEIGGSSDVLHVTMQLRSYLNGQQFRKDVVACYQRFEVLSEAGLRTTVAGLLKKRLRSIGEEARGYRIACEARLSGINLIPDILVWKNNDPRIWIELKDTRTFDTAKASADWDKLIKNCPGYPSIKAGYLIYVARYRSELPDKRTRATMRYWLVKIVLEDHIGSFESWDKEYLERAHYKVGTRARGATAS